MLRESGRAILDRLDCLTEALVAAEDLRRRGTDRFVGPQGRADRRRDVQQYLAQLAAALEFDSREMFADYVAWYKAMLHSRAVAMSDLEEFLAASVRVLRAQLPADCAAHATELVDVVARRLPAMSVAAPAGAGGSARHAALAYQYRQALLRGDRAAAGRLVLDAVARGVPIDELYLEVFQPAQHEAGRLWQIDEIGVAQEHFCTSTTQWLMSSLYPRLRPKRRNGRTLVAACAAGEQHTMGLRMVSDFFEMAGWTSCLTSADTPQSDIVGLLAQKGAVLLALSASLASRLPDLHALARAVRRDPRCAGVKILVGGHPFNRDPGLWRQVGADGYARDALEAMVVARSWSGHRKRPALRAVK